MRRHPRRAARSLAVLAVLTMALAPVVAQVPDRDFLESCEVPGVAGPALCGTYEVFENRETRAGRKIGLEVIVLPATGAEREPDAITVLLGGPGLAATRAAAGAAREYAALRERRDILLVDQRGTGGSNPLNCDLFGPREELEGYLGDFFPLDAVRRCRAELEPKADLTLYTTPTAMDDLDEVRAALGYERLNLIGHSYGTRAALVYMRRHPGSVRTAILHGVAPTTAPIPLDFARDAQRALDSVIGECLAEIPCQVAFPDLRTEAQAVFDGLRAGPAAVEILHPETGEPATIRLSRDLAAEAVRYLLYNSSSALLVPAVLHAAAGGDFTALAEFALFARREIVASGSNGMYLSVTCAEDLPFVDLAEARRRAEGTFLGDYRARLQKAACALWPRGTIPPDYREPVRSSAHTLILSGEYDPVTPPRLGHDVAEHLENSLHWTIQYGGHSFEGLVGLECLDRLEREVVERGTVDGLVSSCVLDIERPPFPTSLPPMRPVAIEPEELRRLAGRYADESSGFEVRVEPVDGKLRVHFPSGQSLVLVPVAPGRFRTLGFLGAQVVFYLDGEQVTELVVEESGNPTLRLSPTPR